MPRRTANAYLEGAEELQATLEKMLRSTEDLRPVWPLYHDAFEKAEADYFTSQGDGTWRPLKRRYARWKAKHGGGLGTLRLTDRLFFSLAAQTGWHIYEPTPRYVRFGTKDPVANIHFSKKGRNKRRPMDVNSPAMQSHMRDAVERHAELYGQMWEANSAV